MGAYDGAEICELVGIFMLSLLSEKYSSNNIGLYRDDGLSVFRNISGQQAEKHKKIIQKIFKDKGLQIIIKCSLKIVDYLDVTLNLNDGTSPANYQENSKIYCKRFSGLTSYNEKLNYTEENNKTNKKSWKRNIPWFNPPYSKSVKTNIVKLFLHLINKNFPPTHKYRKIFNRNT